MRLRAPGSKSPLIVKSSAPKEGLDARRAALTLFQAALSHRGGLEESLNTAVLAGLSPLDRGFARQLTLTALRRLGPIDRALDERLSKEPPEPARDLMRLGLAQALWMDTPVFAAVDTVVDLAPKPLRGLVNGVLRTALRESDVIGRLGGDEFVVLLTDSDRGATQEVTHRLAQLLDERNAEAQRGYDIRYSVGQIQYDPARHRSVADLLAAADAAMYSHKQASKARAAHHN